MHDAKQSSGTTLAPSNVHHARGARVSDLRTCLVDSGANTVLPGRMYRR
jgi:hypothetical protein